MVAGSSSVGVSGWTGEMEQVDCDVLVVGGGLAALSAAIEARRAGLDVIVACKSKAGSSGNSIVAGNGVAGCTAYDSEEELEAHFNDTMRGGDGINDPRLVETLVTRSGEALLWQEELGIAFRRDSSELVGLMAPGHSRPRYRPVVSDGYVSRVKGLSMTRPLFKAACSLGIRIVDHVAIWQLFVEESRIRGAFGLERKTGQFIFFRTGRFILATGGAGRLFASTNNTGDITGDGLALALRAGARLRDMEFIQAHPLVLQSNNMTLATTLLTEGAVLRNWRGERFMPRYSPEGEAATRDIMARAIFNEMMAAPEAEKGVVLDASGALKGDWAKKYPALYQFLQRRPHFSVDSLPVGPSIHFFMGGICIDSRCRTNVEGLYACGEVVGGVHGANRIAGNALTEAVVFGRIAGQEVAQALKEQGQPTVKKVSNRLLVEALEPLCDGIGKAGVSAGTRTEREQLELDNLRFDLRKAMTKGVSLIRSEKTLMDSKVAVASCLRILASTRVDTRSGMLARWELRSMGQLAEVIIESALRRKESRGAHFRTDYPDKSPESVGSLLVKQEAGQIKYEWLPQTSKVSLCPG